MLEFVALPKLEKQHSILDNIPSAQPHKQDLLNIVRENVFNHQVYGVKR
jgi:hypothetical protein